MGSAAVAAGEKIIPVLENVIEKDDCECVNHRGKKMEMAVVKHEAI